MSLPYTIDVNTQSGLNAGKPRMLFETKFRLEGALGRTYAVFPDGRRFLFVDQEAAPKAREIVVVLNWFEELKRKVK